jgi:hypothetical protein
MRAMAYVEQVSSLGVPWRWNLTRLLSDGSVTPDQNPSTLAIRYRVDVAGSAFGNASNELACIRTAFAQWSVIPGSRLRFEEAGTLNAPADVNLLDAQNHIVWAEPGRAYSGGTLVLGAGVAALTQISGILPGDIFEADTILNRQMLWVTRFSSTERSGLFLESAMLHEVGHLLGLAHTPIGGGTMYWRQPAGVSAAAGLSADELSYARTVYGTTAAQAQAGRLTGAVRVNGQPVSGAVLVAEDAAGNLTGVSVSQADGSYVIEGLPPGPATVRATPLHPKASPFQSGDTYLVSNYDLDPARPTRFSTANTGFLPVTQSFTSTASGTATVNLAVTNGVQAFRIIRLREGLNPALRASWDGTQQIQPGQTNAWFGVYVPNLPATSAVLRITGTGIEVGAAEVIPNALRNFALIQAPVTVATNAASGLRSVSVEANGFTAWANAFLEVLPPFPDFNFDGLDDRFQRRYFNPFTIAVAAPEADPDGDGFLNRREAAMDSDPTDPNSVKYRIVSVRLTASGTTVRWECAPGRRYQVFRRPDLAGAVWTPVGAPVLAQGETAELLDPTPTDQIAFYQVRNAP